MARSGVVTVIDNTRRLTQALDVLANTRVMVGIPAANDEREDGEVTNAMIGYWMENGIPERNVPARPHLGPGVKDARNKVTDYLKQAGRLALDGRPDAVTRAYMAAGQTAVTAIKARIRAGIPPPLADSTLRRRASRRKGARLELAARAAGQAPSNDHVTPLINTGQYLAAITFVLRNVTKVRSYVGRLAGKKSR
jgi:hypothetical protein